MCLPTRIDPVPGVSDTSGMGEIRYRVLIRDPRVKNFVATGTDGTDISGKGDRGRDRRAARG
jgi:hypothetical protein